MTFIYSWSLWIYSVNTSRQWRRSDPLLLGVLSEAADPFPHKTKSIMKGYIKLWMWMEFWYNLKGKLSLTFGTWNEMTAGKLSPYNLDLVGVQVHHLGKPGWKYVCTYIYVWSLILKYQHFIQRHGQNKLLGLWSSRLCCCATWWMELLPPSSWYF
jgi:hypothetical protein